ncbi:peptidase M1 [Pedobacter antarcticus 4BY]|uniref:Peptidase M1 n=2 Tax=Pedobacter antarcticus TaxID=34086 RepID=A0A081PDA6_9SPHI|nr:M1 family metallopeptidase [Pedobacter antarcticus]KEQ28679.1 peptidase M1 [Pedobacter antarcticus 4BY]SFE88664.1 Peptidase family M1 [Pedobacter antarcticus]
MKRILLRGLLCMSLFPLSQSNVFAQETLKPGKSFSRADTLRGSLLPERTWWDVQRYEIGLKPDYNSKTIQGSNKIVYNVVKGHDGRTRMQIDLMVPLVIDSVLYKDGSRLKFEQEGNVWYVQVPKQELKQQNSVHIYYHGKVHEAVRPPWDGGFIFTRDSLGRPWMTVACQGLGASVWYPNKDHQSDEPDKGASLTMTVPDSLVAVGNGRLLFKKDNYDGTTTYKYNVVNPISNYCIIPYIGKYVNFKEKYAGEKGPLDVNYWVLDYNREKAGDYLPDQVHKMFKAFEHWFGPYPFYEDGYQLIDASHTGMEHQSAVSYGNKYKFGYLGRDASGTNWGLKWDFIVIHESGHEWFGNNITTRDLADMWVHEGFTNYSETLFTDYHFGEQAGNMYNYGIRSGIRNDKPIIAAYGVNEMGSGDMYPKGGNLLHTIRHSMNNDDLFRSILRGLNKVFYHQTITSAQVEDYIAKQGKYDYSKVFDQYLRTTNIPTLEFYVDKGNLYHRWTGAVEGFNLPLVLKKAGTATMRIIPTATWQQVKLDQGQQALVTVEGFEKMYYIKAVKTR